MPILLVFGMPSGVPTENALQLIEKLRQKVAKALNIEVVAPSQIPVFLPYTISGLGEKGVVALILGLTPCDKDLNGHKLAQEIGNVIATWLDKQPTVMAENIRFVRVIIPHFDTLRDIFFQENRGELKEQTSPTEPGAIVKVNRDELRDRIITILKRLRMNGETKATAREIRRELATQNISYTDSYVTQLLKGGYIQGIVQVSGPSQALEVEFTGKEIE